MVEGTERLDMDASIRCQERAAEAFKEAEAYRSVRWNDTATAWQREAEYYAWYARFYRGVHK